MAHHFNEKGNVKKSFDNFKSAMMECNKYNSNIDNLGKPARYPYRCKICDKVHISHYIKKIITFNIRDKALLKLNEQLNNNILIKKITL